jgi:hypothetical protein
MSDLRSCCGNASLASQVLNARAKLIPARSNNGLPIDTKLYFSGAPNSKDTAESELPRTPTDVFVAGNTPAIAISKARYVDDDALTILESDWSIPMKKMGAGMSSNDDDLGGVGEGSCVSRSNSHKAAPSTASEESQPRQAERGKRSWSPKIIAPLTRKMFEKQRCESMVFSDACFESQD